MIFVAQSGMNMYNFRKESYFAAFNLRAIAAIEKIVIADTDHLSDSWFKAEILSGLNGAGVEFIDP